MGNLRSRLPPAGLAVAWLFVVGIGVGVAKQDNSIHWKADFIWPSTAALAVHPNQFVLFRKTFQISESGRPACLAIFADSRYRLYVNGSFVGQGPARNPAYWGYYDVFDVASRLRPGLNVIAVEVRWFGRSLAWYEIPPHGGEHGALLCQLNLEVQKTPIVQSDATWKVAEDHAWDWNTPPINGVLGNIEVYHADRAVKGWTEPQFDDRGWTSASVLEGPWGLSSPPVEPYTHLVPRPMAYPEEKEMTPARVVSAGVFSSGPPPTGFFQPRSSLATMGKDMASEEHEPQPSLLRNAEAFTSASSSDYAEIQPGAAGQTPYIILDMGREVAGYLQFSVESSELAAIDIGWSEMMVHGDIPANEPGGNYVAQYFVAPGSQHWTLWDWHGLRYVELSFPHLNAPLRIRAGLLFSTAQLKHGGTFACSNPLLTKLWQMGAYTWQLNTLDGIIGCPTREPDEWVGDAEVQLLVNYASDGTLDIARKFFLDAARDQRQDGAIPAVVASSYKEIVADYEFSYVNALYEYYLETGDRDFVLQLYPSVVQVMAWLRGFQQDDGLLGAMPYRVSLDWFFTFEMQGESSTLNALYVHTLENAAELADLAGDGYHRQMFREGVSCIRAMINGRFWNVNRGLYADGWRAGQQTDGASQIANADTVLYGVAPADAVSGIVAKITDSGLLRGVVFDDRSLQYVTVNGEKLDPTKDIVRAEAYTMFFILQALEEHGYAKAARRIIETLWGPMAATGNDTVWERFEVAGGSFCHAWSAAPTYMLTRYVLGVRPTQPGYKAYVVAPQPAGLSWAKGAVPTVRGTIEVNWQWDAGGSQAATAAQAPESFVLNLQTPFAASVEIVLPELEGKMPSAVFLNAQAVTGPLKIAKAGNYRIEARY
jgi:hypothetical protein